MSKPIRVTDKMKKGARAEFAALLTDLKMSDGEICYRKAFEYKDATAILWLMPLAYNKTVALIHAFSDEVAWHGLAARQAKNEFVIEDICVYPQEVTGSTVNTDQEGYTEWLYEFDDDTFAKIRMQGHSHVNMGVSPSTVDDRHRQQLLDQLDDDMFYIFMVWNKALKMHTLIYDMANNVLYEDGDVDVKIIGDDSLDAFLADAKEKVQKKSAAHRGKAAYRVKQEPDEPPQSIWGGGRGGGFGLHDYYDL